MHPYLIPIVRKMKQHYIKIFKSYTNKVKDTIIDLLKVQLKGIIILTEGDEHLSDHDVHCVNSDFSRQKNILSTSNDGNLEILSDRVLSFEHSMVEVVAHVWEEKLRRIE